MTKFKGLPLFGKDSSPHNTSVIVGIIATCVIWIILSVCALVIKPKKPVEKYKEVKIVLDTMPSPSEKLKKEEIEEKQEEVIPVETVKEKIIEEKSPEHVKEVMEKVPVETSKNQVVEKTGNSVSVANNNNLKQKTEESKKPKEEKKSEKQTEKYSTDSKIQDKKSIVDEKPIEYALDPMEAFAQQTSVAKKKEVNWDNMFDDDSSAEVSGQTGGKVIGGNSFSGTAGHVAKQSSTSSRTVSQQVTNDNYSSKVSEATSGALGAIAATKFAGNEVKGVTSQATVNASKTDGKIYIQMSKGRPRALIHPASPVITLSEKAASLIDGNKIVTIKITVLGNGNVPRNQIEITPASIFGESGGIIIEEIKNQICKWQFEPADYAATADFEYKILKK